MTFFSILLKILVQFNYFWTAVVLGLPGGFVVKACPGVQAYFSEVAISVHFYAGMWPLKGS